MTAHAPAISVVTPMHNEEACVEEFVRRTDAALTAMGRSYEIIVVSDGSTDRTEELVRKLRGQHPSLRGVFLARNGGQCTALYAGIQESRGDVVVVMDGDLQHLPEEIHLLVDRMDDGTALVSGSRTGRTESLVLRRLPSRLANAMLRRVSGCPIRDMGGFKAIRGDVARALRLRPGHHRLLPALVWMRGGSVAEVFVSAPPRFAGQSHYGLGRSMDVLFDVVMLWFQGATRSRPMYLFGRVGLVVLALDALAGAWLLWEKLYRGEPLTERPMFFVVVMLFLAALFMLAMGFVLELLSDAVNGIGNGRPYVVRERLGS
ncbi:MAG: glycosyltransferase [Proteobacteria bacterium]|nr:glycosyltransferase [Pseudomonadota bacterium]